MFLQQISDINPTVGPSPWSQSFTFKSLVTQSIYDGEYTFTFQGIDCSQPSNCTSTANFVYTFKVILRIEDETDLYAALKFDVDIYDDDQFNIHHVDVSDHHSRYDRVLISRAFLLWKYRLFQEHIGRSSDR